MLWQFRCYMHVLASDRYYGHYPGHDSDAIERSTIPMADAAVNTLRKHFINFETCSMKRSQQGNGVYHALNLLFDVRNP